MTAPVIERAAQATADTQAKRPLVPSITNVITIDFVANAQLAVGASAAMVYMEDEADGIARMGGAFYLNCGSMLPVHKTGGPAAMRACAEAGVPWVLDPVGMGLGAVRDHLLTEAKSYPPAIVRCNASEALALARFWGLDVCADGDLSHVVDSSDEVEAALEAAMQLARFIKGAVAVSGEVDLVTDGETVVRIKGGSEYFTRITGSGCSLGGVCAAYAAVTDPFAAAVAGSAVYAVAGARAAEKATGPASFKVAFLDELYHIVPADVLAADIAVQEV